MSDQLVRDERIGDADIETLFLTFCLSDSDGDADQLAAAVLDHPDVGMLVAARKDQPESRAYVFRLGRRDVIRQATPVGGRKRDWTGTAVRWLVDLDATWVES